MSAVELTARTTAPSEERALCGWGRTVHSRCRVIRPRRAQNVVDVLAGKSQGGFGVIARGAGCSYGDAAQNAGGEVLDMTGYDRVLSIDPSEPLVTAQAGVTLGQLMARLAAHGLMLPVVPGTRHVTLGGAIASDIHGKNHHRDGGMARHVMALSICTPAAGCVEASPEVDPDLFYGTLGGMGLTGVIVQATLRVERLASPWVTADIDRTDGLEQTLEVLAGEGRHRYSVAWMDLLAAGSKMGRAVISRADPMPAGAVIPAGPRLPGTRSAYPAALTRPARVSVPDGFPGGILRPLGVRVFNALHWATSPRRERERPLALIPYFFPLDGVGAWNRLYGPAGLIQYQLVVPSGQEASLVSCFELIRARRLPVFLAVFKRFGERFGGPLSFPLEGWTLAVDMPASAPGLGAALDELDALVAGCGGRVYLSKDARLRPETLASMYPELDRFRELRARVDPDGVLGSDLARRLGLLQAGP